MKPITILLDPFMGYIALGMFDDAHEELEDLPSELKGNPLVLEARLMLLVHLERWEDAALLGESLCRVWPDKIEFHLKTAHCLHKLKRTQDAKEVLLAAPLTMRQTAIYFYTLACYETQLCQHDKARDLLRHCFAIDLKFRQIAFEEVDLEPLWNCIIV